MSIGAAKCNIVAVSRGHLVDSDSVSLSSGDLIHYLSPIGVYKYLGILESDSFKQHQMKTLLTKEYKRRVRKFLRTNLYSKHLITAINTCAVSLLRYSGGIIDWSQTELRKMDVDTRKLMTMHGCFSMNSDVDRLYVLRKNGGRGLISVKFAIEHELRNLSFYVHHSDDPYIKLIATSFPTFEEHGKQYKQSNNNKLIQTWQSKPLHGQFQRETSEHVCVKSQWLWLRTGNLTKEMEGLIFAAQEQALSTNAIKAHIYRTSCSARCRLCGSFDETIDHLVSCCTVLAQREYKSRHDNVASHVHWMLAKHAGFPVQDNWWKHSPSRVCENGSYKLLWDFSIVTDASLQHNRPDITMVFKHTNEVCLIDIAVPGDSRLSQKVIEKQTKYLELKIELTRVWRCKKVCIIPIVIGALGSIPKDLSSQLKKLQLPSSLIQSFQKTVLYSTASLLRRYLSL